MSVTTTSIKNPDAPGGRKDWEGRTPRWRFSASHAELEILRAWGEYYIVNVVGGKFDPLHEALMVKVTQTIEKIQKPLTQTVPDFGLLDQQE